MKCHKKDMKMVLFYYPVTLKKWIWRWHLNILMWPGSNFNLNILLKFRTHTGGKLLLSVVVNYKENTRRNQDWNISDRDSHIKFYLTKDSLHLNYGWEGVLLGWCTSPHNSAQHIANHTEKKFLLFKKKNVANSCLEFVL